MEKLTKRNGKGIWLRDIEKGMRRFDAPLKWLLERITMRENEIERIKQNGDIEERVMDQLI